MTEVRRASPTQIARLLRSGINSEEIREGLPGLCEVVEEAARRLEYMGALLSWASGVRIAGPSVDPGSEKAPEAEAPRATILPTSGNGPKRGLTSPMKPRRSPARPRG